MIPIGKNYGLRGLKDCKPIMEIQVREHAHIHMDLAPYGKMLGLSSHFEYNIAQANSFREDFGARGIFSLAPNQDTKRFHKHVVASHKGARILFSEALFYKNINNRIYPKDGG